MDIYIKAMRAARSICTPNALKHLLDAIMDEALRGYKLGVLDVLAYGDICNEYAQIVKTENLVNYT